MERDGFAVSRERFADSAGQEKWKKSGSAGDQTRDKGAWGLALDPDGPNLLEPFPAEPMAIWPISTRVSSPKNDDADLLVPLVEREPSA
jgi:hypothetical protein